MEHRHVLCRCPRSGFAYEMEHGNHSRCLSLNDLQDWRRRRGSWSRKETVWPGTNARLATCKLRGTGPGAPPLGAQVSWSADGGMALASQSYCKLQWEVPSSGRRGENDGSQYLG